MAALQEFIQDGIRHLPSKELAKSVGLSPQYLTRFCREGRVAAVGNNKLRHELTTTRLGRACLSTPCRGLADAATCRWAPRPSISAHSLHYAAWPARLDA
jgi:hypothetical protein